MIASLVVALSLPLIGHPATVHSDTVHVREWRLVRRTDSFTGAVTCAIVGRGVRIDDDLAVFDFGRSADTSKAAYRIDDGPTVEARNSLEARRFWIARQDRAPLSNPSEGLLAVPLRALMGANTIEVRVDAGHAVRKFALGSLNQIVDQAAALDCPRFGGN